MTGAIIVTTASYFILLYLIDWGLGYANVSPNLFYQLAAYVIAGFLGGAQFVRTEWKHMNLAAIVGLAFKSFAAIIFAPFAIWLAVSLPTLLVIGANAPTALADIAGSITLAGVIAVITTILTALPCLVGGITMGQWIKARRLQRR